MSMHPFPTTAVSRFLPGQSDALDARSASSRFRRLLIAGALPILGFGLFSSCGAAAADATEGAGAISLDGTWTAKGFEIGMGMWKPSYRILIVDPPPDPVQLTKDAIPAAVPGSIQTALVKAGVVPDPYVEEQGKKILWVEEREWWYVREFDVPADWQGQLVTLESGMVNYRADVWINQTWCGVTYGNYLRLAMDATKALKYGGRNLIAIRLRAPENSSKGIPDLWFERGSRDKSLMRRSWVTPTSPQASEFLMSRCLFGWDWGPHLVPIGILQPIRLVARGALEVGPPFMTTRALTPQGDAQMAFTTVVRNHSERALDGRVDLIIRQKGSATPVLRKTYQVTAPPRGEAPVSDVFTMVKPALWWPRPLGDQPLYEMEVTVGDKTGRLQDRAVRTFGVRTLEKIANEDPHWLDGVSIPQHELADGIYNWTFVINGVKVFAQGVNWIPVDAMLDLHPERYRYLLRIAADAGVNMLRVWGEGLYETDTFYDLCDANGIMVWQDFWLGSHSPAQSQDTSREAARTNVERTRNHPSLVVYCGGNEFDASRPDRLAQMDDLIRIVHEADSTREFQKASPHGGDQHGGMGIVPPETRPRRYFRFVSEGGYTQSWPPRSDMRKFMREDHLFPIYGNEDRLAYRNVSLIGTPHQNDAVFGVPTSLDELIHIEMLNNVIGWQSELENTRLERFRVSGCLFWAHNDVWPTTSWSMIDWYGTAKNHYYAFKKAGRPVQVTASQRQAILKPGDPYDLDVCLLNDGREPLQDLRVVATVHLGEKGTRVYEKELRGSVGAGSVAHLGRLDWRIPDAPAEHNFLLRLELRDARGTLLARNEYTCMIGDAQLKSVSGGFFGEYHHWAKNPLQPVVEGFPGKLTRGEERRFTITCENTTPNVIMGLETLIPDLPEGIRLYLDDNYVHLLPGEKRTLHASIEATERATVSGRVELTLETDGWNVTRQARKLPLDIVQ